MSVIFVLIPLAVIIVAIAIGVFFWAVKSNQFEDLERQGYSILFDDDLKKSNDTPFENGKSSEQIEASKNSDNSSNSNSDPTLQNQSTPDQASKSATKNFEIDDSDKVTKSRD